MTQREIREQNAEQATGPERNEHGGWKASIRRLTPRFHKADKPVMIITCGEWTSKAPADAGGDNVIAQARQGVSGSGGQFHFTTTTARHD